jgi:hypothetical protein
MAESKTFFEQISVETVKTITQVENAIVRDGGDTEMPDEAKSPRQNWRELAQKIQHERDSKRITELVGQLIAALDEEQLCKRLPRKREAGNSSESRD